jgi:integrase
VVARDGTGPKVLRSVTSCADCLGWGRTYAQGVCLACYNFAATRFRQHLGRCAACRRQVRLKRGYCRLCWCQAREDRAVSALDARSRVVLAGFVAQVGCHQLFLADLYRPKAHPRTAPRRRGVKGRPLKQPPPIAVRPRSDGAQLPLLPDLPRTYRPATVDLRSAAAPDNPWLAWALHLAHTTAEARGFEPMVRRALNRNLVMLLATHTDGDRVRASEFHRVIRNHGGALIHVIDVLAAMDVLHDDRPSVFDTWLAAKLDQLAPGIAEQTQHWAHVLRHGGPRRRPRHPATAMAYLNAVRPALLGWSSTHDHLRAVTRDDVIGYLDTVAPIPRMGALTALRSLFAWATRERVIFRNPARRIRGSSRADPVRQRLTDDDIARAVRAARTPQARVYVTLAAVHAARPGQIRALHLDDVDLGNRRLTIAGTPRPLDDLTHRVILDWLRHRSSRWPRTANPHLLISKETALRHGPVSATFILDLRGQPASLERLRIDRQLEEALAQAGDPLALAAMFGIAESTAITYAINARRLLDADHEARPSGSFSTQASDPDNVPGGHSGSR